MDESSKEDCAAISEINENENLDRNQNLVVRKINQKMHTKIIDIYRETSDCTRKLVDLTIASNSLSDILLEIKNKFSPKTSDTRSNTGLPATQTAVTTPGVNVGISETPFHLDEITEKRPAFCDIFNPLSDANFPDTAEAKRFMHLDENLSNIFGNPPLRSSISPKVPVDSNELYEEMLKTMCPSISTDQSSVEMLEKNESSSSETSNSQDSRNQIDMNITMEDPKIPESPKCKDSIEDDMLLDKSDKNDNKSYKMITNKKYYNVPSKRSPIKGSQHKDIILEQPLKLPDKNERKYIKAPERKTNSLTGDDGDNSKIPLVKSPTENIHSECLSSSENKQVESKILPVKLKESARWQEEGNDEESSNPIENSIDDYESVDLSKYPEAQSFRDAVKSEKKREIIYIGSPEMKTDLILLILPESMSKYDAGSSRDRNALELVSSPEENTGGKLVNAPIEATKETEVEIKRLDDNKTEMGQIKSDDTNINKEDNYPFREKGNLNFMKSPEKKDNIDYAESQEINSNQHAVKSSQIQGNLGPVKFPEGNRDVYSEKAQGIQSNIDSAHSPHRKNDINYEKSPKREGNVHSIEDLDANINSEPVKLPITKSKLNPVTSCDEKHNQESINLLERMRDHTFTNPIEEKYELYSMKYPDKAIHVKPVKSPEKVINIKSLKSSEINIIVESANDTNENKVQIKSEKSHETEIQNEAVKPMERRRDSDLVISSDKTEGNSVSIKRERNSSMGFIADQMKQIFAKGIKPHKTTTHGKAVVSREGNCYAETKYSDGFDTIIENTLLTKEGIITVIKSTEEKFNVKTEEEESCEITSRTPELINTPEQLKSTESGSAIKVVDYTLTKNDESSNKSPVKKSGRKTVRFLIEDIEEKISKVSQDKDELKSVKPPDWKIEIETTTLPEGIVKEYGIRSLEIISTPKTISPTLKSNTGYESSAKLQKDPENTPPSKEEVKQKVSSLNGHRNPHSEETFQHNEAKNQQISNGNKSLTFETKLKDVFDPKYRTLSRGPFDISKTESPQTDKYVEEENKYILSQKEELNNDKIEMEVCPDSSRKEAESIKPSTRYNISTEFITGETGYTDLELPKPLFNAASFNCNEEGKNNIDLSNNSLELIANKLLQELEHLQESMKNNNELLDIVFKKNFER